MLGMAAVRRLPDGIRWLSSSARVSAGRTGEVVATILLDDYRQTLGEIRQVGFGGFAVRQFGPYLRAALNQFAPTRLTLTERLIAKTSRTKP